MDRIEKKSEDKPTQDGNPDLESKIGNTKADIAVDNLHVNPVTEKQDVTNEDKKEEEEEDEEEEEEEEDRIIEKSPNLRFHKRNKKYMRKVPGIDSSFIAIEPKSGKEVIWNEIQLSDKRNDQESRFINLIKKLKRYNHPFFVRFLDVWQTKTEGAARKIIFITERLTDPTMKQYFVNSSSSQRLTNKSLWRKFVGQLLSVLKFLEHLGVHHGNLSNETVYYQNTGCLKVGTLAVDLTFDGKSSSDIYDVGMLALEMTAYESSDDAENLGAKERMQRMLARVTDSAQCGFIQTCIDNGGEGSPSLAKLFQHVVLKEVPSLKRVAAKVIVQHFLTTAEEGKDEKMESSTQHSVFSSLIKDQVSHFEDETVLFKVVFGHENITKLRLWKEFRVNFTNLPKYLEDVRNGFYPIFEGKSDHMLEEAEDITFSYSVDQEISKEGLLVAVGGLLVPMVSSKESAASIAVMGTSEIPDSQTKDVLLSEKPNNKETTVAFIEPKDEIVNVTVPGEPHLTQPSSLADATKTGPEKPTFQESPQPSPVILVIDQLLPKTDNPSSTPEMRRGSLEEAKTEQTAPEAASTAIQEPEDTNENEIDEDEDDDDDEDFNNGGAERIEPFWDYVAPPEKPPGDRALFTGCMYTYIGCGRWQIYVQMWFLEDRLKREVIIQVMEHDWSDDAQIATMFEVGKIISAADRPVLERILGYARHNCPLVDGELVPPRTVLASIDAYDLYLRLEHLQMFDKARQLLERAEHEQAQARVPPSPVQAGSGLSSAISSVHHHPTQMASSVHTPGERLQGPPPATLAEEAVSGATRTPKASPLSEAADDKAAILRNVKIGELPGFKMELMDIRILAPLNFSCMFCDNHDYMHNEDLPPYLSSPCYHCREGLAKEAKISPASLFDLHQQNLVPWPAFLQVRYNMPPASENVMSVKDLIDYDCKWRGRSPCRCYAEVVLPPCVEFPNMYADEGSDNGGHIPYYDQTNDQQPPQNVATESVDGNQRNNNPRGNAGPLAVYPCSKRHMKGATITCVHGFTFPRLLAYPGHGHPVYKKVAK